jgi:hypothetical protein
MSISRPFAYNTGSVIEGTIQVGTLAVGTPTSGFTNNPRFWEGPDEELGYVITVPQSGNTQPTPILGVTASVQFYRTDAVTNNEFISLAEYVSRKFNTPQTFATASEASIWLTSNGYWNSYTAPVSSALTLGWYNISNVDLLVGDASDVDDWNAYFKLPDNGTPFTSVTVVGNNVELYGGANINLKDDLITYNDNLISVVDDANCIITAGVNCFQYCPSVTTFDLPSLTTAGYNCFAYCYSTTTFDLPSLITVDLYCFAECYSTTTFDLPSLITAGDYCFGYCSSVITFNLPLLETAGGACFSYCYSVTAFDLPLLETAGDYCFNNCSLTTTFDLPSLITAGDYCFGYCTSVTSFNLASCANLGGTVGDDYVFEGINGNTITLTVPSALMTCNSGNPDGDIEYLQGNNTVTILNPPLTLGWDNISNADLLVGDASDVDDWNTYFELPVNGTPFTSVTVVGNNVELYGGSNINLIKFLFRYNTNLISVVDYANCIITASDSAFNDCTSVTIFDLPSLTFAGTICFANCPSVTTFDLPSLITANYGCFQYCTSVTTFELPSLTTAGDYCFANCPSVTTFDLPSLITADYGCFQYCTSVNTFILYSLSDLGGSVGNNQVFYGILGNTITLIVPSDLMTCNGGNPDGDIQYLQANNTVTVIT